MKQQLLDTKIIKTFLQKLFLLPVYRLVFQKFILFKL